MKMKTTLTVLLILELYGLSSGLNKQHFFVNKDKKWDCARQYCRTYYHDLSTFTTESEKQRFIAAAVGQTSDAWVGLYKESKFWKWTGGEYAPQKCWDSLNKKGKHEDCAFIHKYTKGLSDERCDTNHPFFCMRMEFPLVLQNKSWEEALEYCRNNYNDLATLNSVNKMNSVSVNITQAQTEYVWTGLRFLAGEWLWINGDDIDFTAWSQTGQPQCPAGNLRCGAMNKQTMVWTQIDCEEKLNFFCQ